MEVYAGFLEFTDHHVGRLLDAIEDLGVLENTLVYYIIGDNGASAEGTLNGTYNEMINFNGAAALETPEFMIERLDDFGGPTRTTTTPSAGRTRCARPTSGRSRSRRTGAARATARSSTGPRGSRRGARSAASSRHVIDVAPTVLEAAGLPEPTFVNGVQQKPIEGVSMTYSFDDAGAAERHTTQYFEMFGNRGIYHQGWTAVTRHRIPWVLVGDAKPAFDDDVWELYDTTTDWTQAKDLAAEHPEKLAELQRLFLIEATKHNVLPLDDRGAERADPGHRRTPDARAGRPAAPLRRHGPALRELGGQHQEQVARRHRGDRGARGRRAGRDRRPGRQHRRLEPLYQGRQAPVLLQPPWLQRFHVDGDREVPDGTHQVRAGVRLRRRGLGKGGDVTSTSTASRSARATSPRPPR